MTTKEQTKELWEWCGQYKVCDYCDAGRIYWAGVDSNVYYLCSACAGEGHFHPPIDLNSLFKHAVEGKLKELGYHVTYSIDYDPEMISRGRPLKHYWAILRGSHHLLGAGEDKDPAEALFQALYEVMKNEKENSN